MLAHPANAVPAAPAAASLRNSRLLNPVMAFPYFCAA
jgi:hypothetical protein